jgi:Family of unknown function (DUF5522)
MGCDRHHTSIVGHLSCAVQLVNDTKQIPLQIVPLLRDQYLVQPHPSRLTPQHSRFDEIMRRHAEAVEAGVPCYDDPATHLSVFTAAFLAERAYCCDSGCRHCPYVID